MPYIYKITNDINNKIYIGKTYKNIYVRFNEHCRDCFRQSKEHRPLYAAMRKYGINHFCVELVEECSSNILEDREIYWINFFDSYYYGYNATLGGDGRCIYDYNTIYECFKQCNENCTKTASKLNIDESTVSKAVKACGGKILDKGQSLRKMVNMYSKNGEYIKTFPSIRDAARYLIQLNNLDASNENGYSGHISEVCRGKRKSALGYKWSFA